MNKTTSAPKKAPSEKDDVKSNQKQEIFRRLKEVMASFVPPLRVLKDASTNYELISNKPIIYRGVKREGMYFASVAIQGSYVGLYLMHVYMQPGNLEKLGAQLRPCLKGKSCFHIKKLDKLLLTQVKDALKDGIDTYKKAGFM